VGGIRISENNSILGPGGPKKDVCYVAIKLIRKPKGWFYVQKNRKRQSWAMVGL